jgi:hypothetical protein
MPKNQNHFAEIGIIRKAISDYKTGTITLKECAESYNIKYSVLRYYLYNPKRLNMCQNTISTISHDSKPVIKKYVEHVKSEQYNDNIADTESTELMNRNEIVSIKKKLGYTFNNALDNVQNNI